MVAHACAHFLGICNTLILCSQWCEQAPCHEHDDASQGIWYIHAYLLVEVLQHTHSVFAVVQAGPKP